MGMLLPRLFELIIRFPHKGLADPVASLQAQLDKLDLADPTAACLSGRQVRQVRLKPAQTVAVTAGSRGITDIVVFLRTVVSFLRARGADPFVFPAMGSHGGATAEGQASALAHLGITTESVGAPIRSSIETVRIADSPEGIPIHQDRFAHKADWVVPVNRVKRHTGFTGPTGSGLLKMLAIGVGNPTGARTVHSFGPVLGYENAIQSAGRAALENTRVLFGVALIEDAWGDTAEVRVCGPDGIGRTDRELLKLSGTMTPKLPVDEIDLLIVDRMGKNISGTGMDTHVIGRLRTAGAVRPGSPRIRRIFVREMTSESGGNAIGIGLADFATDRLISRIDHAATYTNCLTSMSPEQAQIPIHYPSDRECIDRALDAVGAVGTDQLRIIRIADTSHLSRLTVSEAVLEELKRRDDVTVVREVPWQFDASANLL